jgi:phosphatidate cytidylyltransferase
MTSYFASSLAQNHVGSSHNVNLGVSRIQSTQSRPCILDLRGVEAPSPSDRRTSRHVLCLPASLGRSTRRYTRRVSAAEASNLGDSSASSSFDAVSSSSIEDATPAKPKGPSSLAKRAIFGTLLGTSGAVVILLGGWVYAAVTCLVAFQCSKEFTGLVNAKGISEGMKPPPPVITNAISLLCVALNAWAYRSGGKTASAMAVATFIVLSLQLLASRKPRFAQLTSAVFGLVYCGYLPSFWIKLRLLAMPALHSTVMQNWQSAVGGVTQATVGVVACFVTVACIIAADTGAYFCGKSLGKTKLISISPKKTVEGAIGGLLSSIGVALALCKLFAWPDNPISAAALGTVIFVSSLFGDLIESVIKRDAGLKDASNLIPGHGGLLDRMDSYLFTGACVYFYIRYCISGYGVL